MDYSTLDGGKRNMQLHSFILSAQLWQIEKQIVSSGKLSFLLWSISLLVERLCSANYEISNWLLGWTCLNIETIHWRCSGDDQWFQIIIVVAKMIGSSQQAQDQNRKVSWTWPPLSCAQCTCFDSRKSLLIKHIWDFDVILCFTFAPIARKVKMGTERSG